VARQNLLLNDARNIELISGAASERRGTLTFNRGLNGRVDDGSGAWGQVQVRAYTVDELAEMFGAPDVLLVDVEGFEQQVLRGAAKVLATRPDCAVEVHVGAGLEGFGGSAGGVCDMFADEDYQRWIVNDQQQAPIAHDPAHPMLRDRFHLIAIARR
ncbi:MAG: FkbM family methyltransferase, partial [Tepidisphaeraceae bacterium]